MKKIMYIAMLAGVLMLAITGCKKEEPTPSTPQKGDVKIEFNHVWAANELPFFMNTDMFHPKTGDTLNFSEFKYYVCNFSLVREDNTVWESDDFYHLIDLEDPTTLNWVFSNLPVGTYVSMQFTLGVDSARTVNGPQTGDLDPSNGMYWNATDGYIMVKAEGFAPHPTNASFTYHLGGFQGPDKIIMVKDITFPAANLLKITGTSTPKLTFVSNPARLFHNYGSVSTGDVTAPGVDAFTLANAFFDAVRLNEISN